jgi:hypothetical protein
MILAAALIAAGGILVLIAKTSTLSDFHGTAGESKISILVSIVSYRLTEFGELLVNLPVSKAPAQLQTIVPWSGLVLLLLILLGLMTKRKHIGPTEAYLICYLVIMFVWPYKDARFWLPVLPLLIGYSATAIRSLRLPAGIVTVYCLVFSAIGFAAIAYSTRISFSGSRFPDRYGDRALRPTYCAVFRSCSDAGDPNKVDPKVLSLLREFNQ